MEESGEPLTLDSREPSIPVAEFVNSEVRFSSLARSDPDRSAYLMKLLERDAAERWRYYSQLAGVHRTLVSDGVEDEPEEDGEGADGSAAATAAVATDEEAKP
jgi:pyruvate-ferredoxin/flavodoxin oxidoreductase